MPRRTYERDGQTIESVDDVDELVTDKGPVGAPTQQKHDGANGVTKSG